MKFNECWFMSSILSTVRMHIRYQSTLASGSEAGLAGPKCVVVSTLFVNPVEVVCNYPVQVSHNICHVSFKFCKFVVVVPCLYVAGNIGVNRSLNATHQNV